MYLQERMYSKCSTLTMAGISDILSKNYEAFFPFHILKGKYDWDGDISWTMTSSGHFFQNGLGLS